MKKLCPWLLVFCLMPAIISSCKKDRINEPQNVEEKWFFDEVVFEEFNAADSVLATETESNFTQADYLVLNSDGNFDLILGGERLRGIHSMENSVMSLTYNQITNSNQTVAVTLKFQVEEKTTSKFTFYLDEATTTGKTRTTFYLLK